MCDSPCPSGAFGKNCGGVCWNCSIEDCDPIYGCLKTIANKIETTYQGIVFGERICLLKTFLLIYFVKTSSQSFFIVGVIQNSNNQSENELSKFGTSTANNTEDESMFEMAYLLHGLNGVLCLILFAFIFHLCKKSKSTNWNCMTHCENNIQDESHMQDQQGRRKSYDTISDSAITVQACLSLESEYDEIDEKLLIKNLQFSQTLLDDYKHQKFLLKICFVQMV